MFIFNNPNPAGIRVGDCVVRAISIFLNKSWRDTYIDLVCQGLDMSDMPSANRVWSKYLQSKNCYRTLIQTNCPDCYTVSDFCKDNNYGKFLLGTGEHVVTVIDGNYYDTWDSGNEVPIYYWIRR